MGEVSEIWKWRLLGVSGFFNSWEYKNTDAHTNGQTGNQSICTSLHKQIRCPHLTPKTIGKPKILYHIVTSESLRYYINNFGLEVDLLVLLIWLKDSPPYFYTLRLFNFVQMYVCNRHTAWRAIWSVFIFAKELAFCLSKHSIVCEKMHAMWTYPQNKCSTTVKHARLTVSNLFCPCKFH